jgi:hypothetical protein
MEPDVAFTLFETQLVVLLDALIESGKDPADFLDLIAREIDFRRDEIPGRTRAAV